GLVVGNDVEVSGGKPMVDVRAAHRATAECTGERRPQGSWKPATFSKSECRQHGHSAVAFGGLESCQVLGESLTRAGGEAAKPLPVDWDVTACQVAGRCGRHQE